MRIRLARAILPLLLALASVSPAAAPGSAADAHLATARTPIAPLAPAVPWVAGEPADLLVDATAPSSGLPPFGPADPHAAGPTSGPWLRLAPPRDGAGAVRARGFRAHATRAPPFLS